MQLIVEIDNRSVAEKIKAILNIFKSEGVKVQEVGNGTSQMGETPRSLSENFAEKWREIGMNTHSADLDDDERLYEAYARFDRDKHSD